MFKNVCAEYFTGPGQQFVMGEDRIPAWARFFVPIHTSPGFTYPPMHWVLGLLTGGEVDGRALNTHPHLAKNKKNMYSFPATVLEGPLGFLEVEAPELLDSRYIKVVRLSALRTSRLYPPGRIPGTHFC